MKVLVFGNSHLAALKSAWEGGHRPAGTGMEATFVGAHKGLLLQAEVTDGVYRPASAAAAQALSRLGAPRDVRLADYDLIVIAGAMVSLAQATILWRDARWPGLPSLERAADVAAPGPTLISQEAALASLCGALGEKLGPRLAAMLSAATDVPIRIACQPRYSAAVRAAPRPTTRSLAAAERAGDGAALAALFDRAAAGAAAAAGAGYLPQPPETVEADLYTGLAWMDGAVRLAARPGLPQPGDDVLHANARYGALVLDQVAAEAV
ncbi:hypothetical protein [Wenxinia saemankumensis]|uniref:Uncharacterized protein n=1 Tax=Wenxinia saemankumensis TaxID=1447782 RepID=A0A1M6CW41_9RHOB|nr:hypothetical protein [Wenxinia saemankumensis]SHI65103.1 hypothetical protein SAMN05444417_1392 [Wenxinia saemankumensis]